MAIVYDVKTPITPPSSSDVEQPPEYEEDPPTSPHSSNSTALKPPKTDWWRRWLRSPLAIALVFLGCCVVATGVALAVHFTRSKKGGSGNSGTASSVYGPWMNQTKTYTFPKNTSKISFVANQWFVDGHTSVIVGPPDQEDVILNVSMEWREMMLPSAPTLGPSDSDNATVTLDCPYVVNSSQINLTIVLYANVSLSLPPNGLYPYLNLGSTARAPHCWNLSAAANMTEAGITFGDVDLTAGEGALDVTYMTAKVFKAYTTTGGINGQVYASESYDVQSDAGAVTMVNVGPGKGVPHDQNTAPDET